MSSYLCAARKGWDIICLWTVYLWVCLCLICLLQRASTDISRTPWGDIHHSEWGPLSSHADPQQVSYPTAAKGNCQRSPLQSSHTAMLFIPLGFATCSYLFISSIETPRTEVYCRPLPANCSMHHELYHHFSSFPECRQKEMLPALLLKTTSDHSSPDWTDPIDINCPGTQVKTCKKNPDSLLKFKKK